MNATVHQFMKTNKNSLDSPGLKQDNKIIQCPLINNLLYMNVQKEVYLQDWRMLPVWEKMPAERTAISRLLSKNTSEMYAMKMEYGPQTLSQKPPKKINQFITFKRNTS